MTFTVYGLRLKGALEVRYVGFTSLTPADRLRVHLGKSNYHTAHRPLRQWLRENANEAEVFTICKAKTEAEARAMEKGAISACAHSGNRLFNSDHVPRPLLFREMAVAA